MLSAPPTSIEAAICRAVGIPNTVKTFDRDQSDRLTCVTAFSARSSSAKQHSTSPTSKVLGDLYTDELTRDSDARQVLSSAQVYIDFTWLYPHGH
jgi:hypothetical protein